MSRTARVWIALLALSTTLSACNTNGGYWCACCFDGGNPQPGYHPGHCTPEDLPHNCSDVPPGEDRFCRLRRSANPSRAMALAPSPVAPPETTLASRR